MESFHDKEDYTLEDIQSLIDNQVEESIYLDFKESRALEKSDKKRYEIAKDVASFANSDGGIIIYGIKELDHKASEISYIDGAIYTKEWLEEVINSLIQRRIEGIRIYPVRENGDIQKSIYIVKIPFSYNAPHISKDNRYYKRYNFSSVPMEEYEVRQSYDRKSKTKLSISGWYLYDKYQEEHDEWKKVHFAVQAKNDSNTIESHYKVSLIYQNRTDNLSFEWDRNQKVNMTRLDNGLGKITTLGLEPIYAGETVNVIHIKLLLNKNKIYEALDNVTIKVQLLFSNGRDEIILNLLDEYRKMEAEG
jgi:predicted HTH transcriptional regulator